MLPTDFHLYEMFAPPVREYQLSNQHREIRTEVVWQSDIHSAKLEAFKKLLPSIE
jgi:hypothetical protein